MHPANILLDDNIKVDNAFQYQLDYQQQESQQVNLTENT